MIPADLLCRLREKDPELWSKYRYTEIAEIKCADEECGYIRSIEQDDIIEPAQEAWLQHCLQESIRARGWYYSIWNTSPDSTEVIIRRGGEGYINPDFMHIGEGKNEAEALLIAYLAAV